MMKTFHRNEILEARGNMSWDEVISKSSKIQSKLIALDSFVKAKNVMIYVSKDNEVFTHYLIKDVMLEKKVFVPKVVDRKKTLMEAILLDDFDSLRKGAFGVLEPSVGEIASKLDVVIVPLVAFDKKKQRIGYGKGYYDKYLSDKNVLKIGLAYSNQEIDKVPSKVHDVKLDVVITEDKVYAE